MENNEYLVKMSDYAYLEMKYNQALKDYDEAITRIDKAIEYIEKRWCSKNTTNINEVVSFGDWRVDLFKILKGDSNE